VLLLADVEGYVRFMDVVLSECFVVGPYPVGSCIRRLNVCPLASSSVGIIDVFSAVDDRLRLVLLNSWLAR
jgi:hypothetical protein